MPGAHQQLPEPGAVLPDAPGVQEEDEGSVLEDFLTYRDEHLPPEAVLRDGESGAGRHADCHPAEYRGDGKLPPVCSNGPLRHGGASEINRLSTKSLCMWRENRFF